MFRTVILITVAAITTVKAQTKNEFLDKINSLEGLVSIAQKGKWEEVNNKDGVSINYRDLIIADTIKTRQLLVKFRLKSPSIDSLITQVKLPKHIKIWNDGVSDVKILENKDTKWISHTTYNIPFPFKQQDLVTQSTLTKKENTIILSSKSLPNYIKQQEGVKREGYNFSEWRFKAMANSIVEIEFCAISFTPPRFPKFLRDPIIQRTLINSFVNLKEKAL